MKVLALDFDGVISDSAPESYVVALRTYLAMTPDSPLAADLARVDGEAGCEPARVLADARYRAFVEGMPLGNRAEDFGVLLRALEADAVPEDQAAYDAFRDACGDAFLVEFHRRFYDERHRWSAADPDEWAALLGPYPDFLDVLRRRAGDVFLAIATAKDRPSVDQLLQRYGVAELFPPEAVLDKETGVSKRAHLEELRRRRGVDFGEITFVDDKVNHLEDVASLGVRCALAAWGYNGEREQRRARTLGYLVCGLEDCERQLFRS